MGDPKNQTSEAAAVTEVVERLSGHELLALETYDDAPDELLVIPAGKKVVDLKPFRDLRRAAPERRTGTAKFTDLTSLIAHVKRFADEHTALFASDNPRAPEIVAVLDYHEKTAAGAPRFGKHRAQYTFPVSDEWQAWTALADQKLTQAAFAELLENRILDILDPTAVGQETAELAAKLGIKLAGPTTLLGLSRGLSIHVDQKVLQAVNLSSGEVAVTFEETHRERAGGNKLEAPGGFAVGIPVFRGGARYAIGARLRYRVNAGAITWSVVLHRTDAVFDDAFREACARAQLETGAPLYFGTPES